MYGMPQEGPLGDINISDVVSESVRIQADADLLQKICNDEKIYREFKKCRDLIETLAERLSESSVLVEELQDILFQVDINKYQLTDGIFWYTLAASRDPRADKRNHAELLLPKEIPFLFRHILQVQGSLLFKLYITLVYMKEGVIQKILKKGNSSRMPVLILCRQLLNCDFIRHLRNALSHADFANSIAGIVFCDNAIWYGATPGFLDWLCTWIFTIHHICILVLQSKYAAE